MKMVKNFFISLILLVGYQFCWSQAPVFERFVCPSETLTVYEDTSVKSGDSDKICDSGTRYTSELIDDDGIVKSYNVIRMGPQNEGDNWAKVEIEWEPGKEGTIVLNLYYERRKKKNAVSCEWKGVNQLSTYRIDRRSINPSGTLTGNLIYPSKGNEAISASITFNRNIESQSDTKAIKYWVNDVFQNEITTSENSVKLPFVVNDLGDYIIRTQVKNDCDDWVDGPNETVSVEASCFQDIVNEVSININGEIFHEDGVELYDSKTYTISSSGITDFESHYDLNHDGGNELTLDNKMLSVNSKIGSFRLEATRKDGRESCPIVAPLSIFVGGGNLEISQKCLLILPEDLANFDLEFVPGEPALEHFRGTISSEKGFVIKPGIVLSLGAELQLLYEEPVIDESELNPNLNFIQTTSYNEFGEIINQGRQYFDDIGRARQSQVKNLSEDVIITSEVVYDAYGRAVLSTLPAPSKSGTFKENEDECGDLVQNGFKVKFEYADNFINGIGNEEYDFKKFDLAKEESPDPVLSSSEGSLGWYYSANNGTSSDLKLNEPSVAHTAYPYTRTIFHHDGTESVKSTAGPGETFAVGAGHVAESVNIEIQESDPYLADYLSIRESELKYHFDIETPKIENFFISQYVDEIGRKSWSYQDKSGNSIISLYFGDQNEPITRSYSYYNLRGMLTVSISPNGWNQYNSGVGFELIDKTSYFYNSQQRLMATEETDAGRSEYIYRRDGSIRFSQNALQKANRAFSYTNYDESGRPVESGEIVLSTDFNFREILMPELEKFYGNWVQNMPGSPVKRDWIATYYDVEDANFSNETGYSNFKQRFLKGAVSYSENENTKTWYSYDEIGRIDWMAQKINDFGVKLLEYTYSNNGAVELIAYQRGNEDQFYHFYTYDKDGRLSKVYTAVEEPVYNLQGEIQNREVLKQEAYYDYYLHGPLKRIELADQLQGIDFVYTITGQLKSINDAESDTDPGGDGLNESLFKPDVYGITYDYYNGDHQRGVAIADGVEQFTGNIKAQSWFSPVDGGNQKGYIYAYDQRNQLSNAKFGSVNSSVFTSLSNAFDMNMTNGGYDLNGNILGLSRNDDLGENLHDLNYGYLPNKNVLQNVTHDGNSFRTYTYDEIGQMTSQRNEVNDETQFVEYDATGKVNAIFRQKGESGKMKLAEYKYDDRGFRVSKIVYEDDGVAINDQTWYIRDASGSLIRSYSLDNTLDEYPIYGASRLGMYRPNAIWNDYLYELTDHLGNVRAVLGKDITIEYLGTFEEERSDIEDDQSTDVNGMNGYFGKWASHSIPTFNHTSFDITEDGVPLNLDETSLGGVLRINNAMDNPLSPVRATKMLPVSAGDVLNLEVYVKYADFSATDESLFEDIFTNYLANAFGSFSVGTVTDGGLIGNIFDPALNPFFDPDNLFAAPNEDQPKAYINYIIFDENFKVIDSDRKQVSEAARIPSKPLLPGAITQQEHERLLLEEVKVGQSGFIYVYLSNEDMQNMDVYFDDLKISHTYTNVVAGADFYPYGLTMASRKITREKYRYGYQGEFSEEDEETGWNSFEARMYDPVIGRWLAVDPHRQHFSPYLSMSNSPINTVDPDGRDDVYFNSDGSYSHTVDRYWFVELFIGHRGFIQGDDGFQFSFQDGIRDVELVQQLAKNSNFRLSIYNKDMVFELLELSGVFDQENQANGINYAANQQQITVLPDGSKTSGSMDYTYRYLQENAFYVVKSVGILDPNENVGMNRSNFGNFLWGAGMNALGYNDWLGLLMMKVGSEVRGYKQNEFDREREDFHGLNFGDSGDDQDAIKRGWHYYRRKK